MKPLEPAVRIIAPDHIAVTHFLAITVKLVVVVFVAAATPCALFFFFRGLVLELAAAASCAGVAVVGAFVRACAGASSGSWVCRGSGGECGALGRAVCL